LDALMLVKGAQNFYKADLRWGHFWTKSQPFRLWRPNTSSGLL